MLKAYIWLIGQVVAMVANDAAVYFFHNDHLGTPQKMTNASGTVVWAADYLPFGQANVTISTVENNLRFAGQYFDSETGLHYNYWQFYDPSLGRYLRADPIGLAGGINPYAYVQNNPVNFIDPWGLPQRCINFESIASFLAYAAFFNTSRKCNKSFLTA
jgi:RHS repeat-associated protein